MRLVRWLLVLVLVLVACSRSPGVTDLEGKQVDPLTGSAAVTVLVFASTVCPISNKYAPEIGRLHSQFSPRGVAFYMVYPWATEDVVAVREHVKAYGIPFTALRDPAHALVARAGVTRTPEVAVFARGTLAYRGRIDDRQVDFGLARPEPTRRDLAIALDEVLAGRAVTVSTTTSIGCAIPTK